MLAETDLEALLVRRCGQSRELAGHPAKTRSKMAKRLVREALGLPPCEAFPRGMAPIPEENLDVVVQQSTNFQPWNDALVADRRYAFLLLDAEARIVAVRVVTGAVLLACTRSTHRTVKYQARITRAIPAGVHVVGTDTPQWRAVRDTLAPSTFGLAASPCDAPDAAMHAIEDLAAQLAPLIGTSLGPVEVSDPRAGGAALHAAVCRALGYAAAPDPGTHPDIPHQLVEVKLQEADTIDLGHGRPTSDAPLGPAFPASLRRADVRYVIGRVATTGDVASEAMRTLISLTLVAGAYFEEAFPLCDGASSKQQIPLPPTWWADAVDGGPSPGLRPDPLEFLPLFAAAIADGQFVG